MDLYNKFKKISYILGFLFLIIGLLIGIVALFQKQYFYSFLGFLTPLFFIVFPILKKLNIKPVYSIYSMIFLFCILAYSIGCAYGGYLKFSFLDSLAHFLSGFVFMILGFCFYLYVDSNENKNLKNNLFLLVSYGLFFSLSVAVFWELIEFVDFNLTGHDGQKHLTTGVFDTMKDLIYCFLGSLICGISYLFSAKKNKKLFTYICVEEFFIKNVK